MFIKVDNLLINLNHVKEVGFRTEETCWIRFANRDMPDRVINAPMAWVLARLEHHRMILGNYTEE